MKKIFLLSTAALALSTVSAHADTQNGLYIGAQIGYHDIDTIGADDIDFPDIDDVDISSFNYGGYAGINFDLPANNLVVGAEGNFLLGSNDFDSEYGLTGHLGMTLGPSMLFVRGGYQWVNLDLEEIVEDTLNIDLTDEQSDFIDDLDDTEGGYLLGAGLQIGLGDSLSVRGVVDTIEFDSVRVTGGVAFHF